MDIIDRILNELKTKNKSQVDFAVYTFPVIIAAYICNKISITSGNVNVATVIYSVIVGVVHIVAIIYRLVDVGYSYIVFGYILGFLTSIYCIFEIAKDNQIIKSEVEA